MKAQQLAAELEVEMMADMYNRYEAYGGLCKCVTACFLSDYSRSRHLTYEI